MKQRLYPILLSFAALAATTALLPTNTPATQPILAQTSEPTSTPAPDATPSPEPTPTTTPSPLPTPVPRIQFRRQRPKTEAQFEQQKKLRAELLVKQQEYEASDNQAALILTNAQLDSTDLAIATLYDPATVTDANIENAYPIRTLDRRARWGIGVRFDPEGGKAFAELTRSIAGTGRTIGVFIDGKLVSTTTISADYAATGISGGMIEIYGDFTAEDVVQLAQQLRNPEP